MYFGLTELAGNQPIWVITSTDGVTPVAPTAAPTYRVYQEGSSTVLVTGTMTGPVDTQTGLYRASIAVTAANGFARGLSYIVQMAYAVAGVNYAQSGTFTVT